MVWCALLGAPSVAGAALFGRPALLAAGSSPDDPFNSWAVQASREMESKYTCNDRALTLHSCGEYGHGNQDVHCTSSMRDTS